MTRAPRRRQSSAHDAAQYVRQLIFNGELRQGERIPQDDVAAALSISRVPVREALIALEREGWVTIELHRGAFVNALTENIVRDHYELYGVLYAFLIRRSMVRDGATLAEQLPPLATRFAAAADAGDPDEADRVAVEFADVVTNAAQSPRVRVITRSMSRLVPGNLFTIIPGTLEVDREGLRSIADAVVAGNGNLAALAYQDMMQRIGDLCVEEFSRRGLFVGAGS